ncbi:TonB-dependent receptor [Parabacteroides sp. 52]|uniref:SusC/RagA family TonB-linked outer membrane protein n=1 Tax=unclassified Parabacteroides TaxID=2649774 RepID=UPI0013D30BD5|nr:MULTISPECIES: TonB-dependent receptor [unclassified Parabacteroides]MDH6534154.1 TonB-linked SusC/RagA family outer membrane protein [Parabacteroides sp. PM5-20]NDV54943.1 TonB-dependent receptor [Parabacteroides sp. 52]
MNKQKVNKVHKVFLSLLMCFVSVVTFAQGRQVTGVVSDITGEAVIGANVLVKGTTNGAITDIDGNYAIANVGDNAILVVSYIGYLSQEVSVGNQSIVNVTLKEDAQALEEVVVVGYGVQKKSDLTGAISSVDNTKLVAKGATTVMESLQGQVPGVDISQASSRVGESFNMSIRGKSTLGGSTSPLFVVDGIVSDDINFLNPSDIEKIDILKDASSTAIYGSRATNGVVIVTTKQAKTGGESRVSVTYDGYVGYKTEARMPEFMDDVKWMDFRYMKYATPVKNATITNGRLPLEMTSGNLLSVWNDKGSNLSYKMRDQFINRDFTDWRDLMLSDGTQQNHFIQVAGAGNKVSYRIGAGYQQEDGVMGDKMQRYNIKVAVDGKLHDKFTVGASANMAATDSDYGSKRGVQEAFRANGYWLPYNTETGEVNYQPGKDLAPGQASSLTFPAGFSSSVSPLIDAMNSSDKTKSYRFLSTLYAQYQPIQEVFIKTSFAPTLSISRQGEYYGGLSSMQSSTYNASSNPEGTALATVTKNQMFSYTWDTQVNYIKTFNQDHNINLMGLASVYSWQNEKYGLTGTGVTPNTLWYNLGSASSYSNVNSAFSKNTMLSYAVRLNYSYKGKYLATLSSRWDGSSKFLDGNKWGAFPSAALAWNIGEEDFIREKVDWISYLKLRASYGLTGNNASVGNYETLFLANQLYYSNYGKGFGPETINELLSWEKTSEVNLGLDFSFLQGRLSGSFDWYSKDSKDLLMDQKLLLEQGSNSGSMTANVGKVRNSGIELMLKGILVQNKNVYWDVTATFAKNKNQILELQGKKEDMRAQRWFIGQPIDVAYDLQSTGICTQETANEMMTVNGVTKSKAEWYGWFEGCMTYEDINKDGKINDADRQIIGQGMPKWTGTISTSFAYKNFDFSMSINTKQGHTVYSYFMEEFTDYSDRGRTKLDMDFYIPQGAPMFNYTWDGTNSSSLTSDRTQVAGQTIVGSYPYPFNDVNYNHGGGTGWHTGKNTEFGSKNYVDASYWKIKNITVGYTFPRILANRIGLETLRVYANVLNPFTFTDYKGFDPEWADAKINDGTGGPSSITYQIGLNVKF